GYTGPAASADTFTFSRERHVEVDGKVADAVLGRFQKGKEQFVAVLEGKGARDPLDHPFAGRRMSIRVNVANGSPTVSRGSLGPCQALIPFEDILRNMFQEALEIFKSTEVPPMCQMALL